ncbi:MAG: HAMP domain-containing sensor histidine kinase [Roseobacter sp.]
MRYENMSYNLDTCCDTSDVFHLDMQASTSELDDFVYLISHDVRNSVRALIELPQWIKEDLSQAGIKAEGSVAESIELMNNHTGRLDRMLVDLLTFSRVGRLADEEPIGVDDALGDILEQLRIPVGFSVRTELSCDTLPMGARDILTLLTQLLSNAIKHHDKSSGEILVTLANLSNHAILRVQDDGPGIPSQYRERIFAAMTTLKPRDEVEGSGMGLAIVRKIVQFYQGQIVVCSGLNGQGTTIEVSMPRTKKSAALNSLQN